MVGPSKKPATLADLLAIPEERRHHEIVDGELVEKEAASGKHGRAQGRVFRHLGPYVSPDGYIDVLSADATERVRAEPFDAIELVVGSLFAEFDDDE